MATLAELRAKLQAQDTSQNSKSNTKSADLTYRFWDNDKDTTSVLRFLPDSDTSNDFFWVERQMINMTFPGVKGGNQSKEVFLQVPCVEMWEGMSCPIHAMLRPMFKDPSLEKLARQYWKKRSFIFQGFVVEDPSNSEKPENPIRKFNINPSIFKLIKAALMDPDMESLPTDFTSGTDFRLIKGVNGQWANYDTSSYARRERTLSEEEMAAIEQYGLNDLKEWLPPKPTAAHMNAIEEMFEASMNGELYDLERWGHYYRPFGMDAPTGSAPAQTPATATAAAVEQPAPVAETAPAVKNVPTAAEPAAEPEMPMPASGTEPKKSTQDILNMLKNRG
jgi:hypothetical protein